MDINLKDSVDLFGQKSSKFSKDNENDLENKDNQMFGIESFNSVHSVDSVESEDHIIMNLNQQMFQPANFSFEHNQEDSLFDINDSDSMLLKEIDLNNRKLQNSDHNHNHINSIELARKNSAKQEEKMLVKKKVSKG
eukprot:CAMPEP_0116897060 /NCGR_PEP_ID=MMETSP0467-20121206/6153_1 /TAXON_ID=283647 /ORGANISM="Mesodinium pulex, Strain SPMC105" /LENGTH=136 /DNA_ID=CAMNT_0004568551 /DNA_START=1524 /DNA_END=1931 /DNA_ORIENTATION=+